MIKTYRSGTLGSNLSQQAFGRILAENWGYKYPVAPLGGFTSSAMEVEGSEFLGPVLRWQGQWPFDAHTGRPITKQELSVPPGARLVLDGFFQRFDLLSEYPDLIRENWMRVQNPFPKRHWRDFAVCLRRCDFPFHKAPTFLESLNSDFVLATEEEIRRLVVQASHARLFFITDMPDHPLIEALQDLGAEILSGTPLQQFRLIHSFQKIAINQNTTEWWATFLGEAREIYFPKLDRGLWAHPEPASQAHDPSYWGIDLRVPDDNRYIYDW